MSKLFYSILSAIFVLFLFNSCRTSASASVTFSLSQNEQQEKKQNPSLLQNEPRGKKLNLLFSLHEPAGDNWRELFSILGSFEYLKIQIDMDRNCVDGMTFTYQGDLYKRLLSDLSKRFGEPRGDNTVQVAYWKLEKQKSALMLLFKKEENITQVLLIPSRSDRDWKKYVPLSCGKNEK